MPDLLGGTPVVVGPYVANSNYGNNLGSVGGDLPTVYSSLSALPVANSVPVGMRAYVSAGSGIAGQWYYSDGAYWDTLGSGGGGGGGVSSVGVTSTTLSVTNSPITGSGNIEVDLPIQAGVAGTYTNLNATLDAYGRVIVAASGSGGGGGGQPIFSNPVSDTSPGSSVNNYSPTGFGPTTDLLKITAAVGGTTITGLSSSGRTTYSEIVMRNMSTTDSINLPQLSSSSSAHNQFANSGSGSGGLGVAILPGNAITLYLDTDNWVICS
jgi:hypothetical protein